MKRIKSDAIPVFVSTRKLETITGRDRRYLLKRMPTTLEINSTLKGWQRETVVKFLTEHPETIIRE